MTLHRRASDIIKVLSDHPGVWMHSRQVYQYFAAAFGPDRAYPHEISSTLRRVGLQHLIERRTVGRNGRPTYEYKAKQEENGS